MEICQQNDYFGLAFDIICKFREMEDKKYMFLYFTDNVVDSWSHLTPIFARAHHPDGGQTES